jgi:rod shape-determining protein MreC
VARAVRSGSRADTGVLALCALLALVATFLPSELRDRMAGALRRTIVAPLLGLQAQAERARAALAGRDMSSARVDSLTLRGVRLADLEQENERLRRLLGLGRELRWGFVPAQALHSRALGDENSILLTAGSAAGITARSAVVAPDGLVGLVTAVDPRTSQAILWTHPEFRASAMASNGSAFGIIKPHLGNEPDRYLLELQGVAEREILKPGTLIRSSGLGGVIPRGIPIGTVIGEAKTSEVWSRTYLVRPAVKPPDVTSVMVVLPTRASGDLTTVWTSTASADSAARRVVAAGDSLAQVHRDSVRRDSVRRDTSRTRP